ncbi:AraC family transcriptional regulator [Variovorax dokdonensis]|uniref:AraC family transcriptional regulator n=1 Tax=Variovorax dokdonensis TaxID=344883 RepID=A0ABT7N4R4_9BURK|nr:AraC family transcriptional regulator [Variovorax dokdonensis]MDM0042910.1 AraC family transcriptional regulator [Variovorax dokdonensis]
MPAATPRPPQRAATPMAFVQAIVRGYERHGRDPSKALAAAQIAPQDLKKAAARVTAAQFESLNEAAMQELDDEALGWFDRRLPWGSYGMLCRASLSSPNLGVAIKRWCRHHLLLTDNVVLSLRAHGGIATVTVQERRPLQPQFREFALVSLLRFLHGYASWAIDSRVSLREAHFPFAQPSHADAYPLMFCDTVTFGAAHAGYSFDERYLQLPLQRDERALRTMLRRALPLTVLQYRRDRLLGQRIRELLRTRAGEVGNANALAGLLNISTRTLHRQLRDEGVTLQALKDEVRRERAMEELRRDKKPIKQVALMVGFRNEKSFARAFRQWTGSTPGEFRRGPGG